MSKTITLMKLILRVSEQPHDASSFPPAHMPAFYHIYIFFFQSQQTKKDSRDDPAQCPHFREK